MQLTRIAEERESINVGWEISRFSWNFPQCGNTAYMVFPRAVYPYTALVFPSQCAGSADSSWSLYASASGCGFRTCAPALFPAQDSGRADSWELSFGLTLHSSARFMKILDAIADNRELGTFWTAANGEWTDYLLYGNFTNSLID